MVLDALAVRDWNKKSEFQVGACIRVEVVRVSYFRSSASGESKMVRSCEHLMRFAILESATYADGFDKAY